LKKRKSLRLSPEKESRGTSRLSSRRRNATRGKSAKKEEDGGASWKRKGKNG